MNINGKRKLPKYVEIIKIYLSWSGVKFYYIVLLSLISSIFEALSITLLFPLFVMLFSKTDYSSANSESFIIKITENLFELLGLNTTFLSVTLIICFLMIVKSSFHLIMLLISSYVKAELQYKFRENLISAFARAEFDFVRKYRAGEFVSFASEQSARVGQGFYSLALTGSGVISALVLIVFVFVNNPFFLLILALIGVFLYLIASNLNRVTNRFSTL